jgi:hypothetical protein
MKNPARSAAPERMPENARRIEGEEAGRLDGQEESGDRAKHQEEADGNPQQAKVRVHVRSD